MDNELVEDQNYVAIRRWIVQSQRNQRLEEEDAILEMGRLQLVVEGRGYHLHGHVHGLQWPER